MKKPRGKITPTPTKLPLLLPRFSVRQLALKHGVSDKTLYATLNGSRPGRDARVQKAVFEAHKTAEALANV